MHYRKLGRTGLEVSCIGFGAIPIVSLRDEEAKGVLNAALDVGMNFIDTARGYRESEELIGASLEHRRAEYYLATKTKSRKEGTIREELYTSLDNLRTDHIDLYQIHYVNNDTELDNVLAPSGPLRTLQAIRSEGICDYIGITGHDAAVLLRAAKTGEFDTIQGAFSYIEKERKILDLIEYCNGENIGFIVQKPLAGGALMPAAPGLRWILGHPVSTVIPGMVSVEQVEENGRVGGEEPVITDREREALDAVVQELGDQFCRRCNYCHPVCPEGIRIGVILEFLGKGKVQDSFALSQRWYRGFEINASNCTECGLCLSECPYELPIPDMLREAHALLK